MKKLIFILLLIPSLAIGQSKLHSQFTREVKEADSLFWNKFEIDAKEAAVDAAMETDSIFSSRSFYNCIYDASVSSDKRKNIIISEDDYLNEFMNAYMLGQLSFYYNKNFNYELLESKLKKIKIELRKNK